MPHAVLHDQRVARLNSDLLWMRLPKKEIARRAELDEMTVAHALAGRTMPLASTLARIEEVVEAEKVELRAKLSATG